MKPQQSGYIFAILAFVVFASQDAISKHLAGTYHPILITFIRYWAFAIFALVIASRSPGGLRAAVRTRHPYLQVFRGALLAIQIAVTIGAFAEAGLIHSQAIFAASPLLVALLSVPVLGEQVGWRRMVAIGVGLVGVMIILKPEGSGFDQRLFLPLLNAVLSAIYSVTTRLVSRDDAAGTSFFYLGVVGCLAMTTVGPLYWQPIAGKDWFWMGVVSVTGMTSHYFLIRAYNTLDAIQVQPISYFQLVWASMLGVVIFNESLHWNIVLGSLIVVGAGLFTIWREAIRQRRDRREQS